MAGFTSETNGIVPNLEEKIIGPWVFVFMNEKDFNMEFYILTKEETIELIKTSCDWYANAYNRELKSKPMVGVEVDWLKGGLSKATKLHPEYKSTLSETSQDKWEKITNLLD